MHWQPDRRRRAARNVWFGSDGEWRLTAHSSTIPLGTTRIDDTFGLMICTLAEESPKLVR